MYLFKNNKTPWHANMVTQLKRESLDRIYFSTELEFKISSFTPKKRQPSLNILKSKIYKHINILPAIIYNTNYNNFIIKL